jgi:7-cyano-7-deazaguanine synthase in queuosine biosynthesis
MCSYIDVVKMNWFYYIHEALKDKLDIHIICLIYNWYILVKALFIQYQSHQEYQIVDRKQCGQCQTCLHNKIAFPKCFLSSD